MWSVHSGIEFCHCTTSKISEAWWTFIYYDASITFCRWRWRSVSVAVIYEIVMSIQQWVCTVCGHKTCVATATVVEQVCVKSHTSGRSFDTGCCPRLDTATINRYLLLMPGLQHTSCILYISKRNSQVFLSDSNRHLCWHQSWHSDTTFTFRVDYHFSCPVCFQ